MVTVDNAKRMRLVGQELLLINSQKCLFTEAIVRNALGCRNQGPP